MKQLWTVVGALSLSVIHLETRANVGDDYGLGSRDSAFAGASAAWGQNGFGSYLNPASLARDDDTRIQVSWGAIYMKPKLKSIGPVVVDTAYNSDQSGNGTATGPVDTSYLSTFGQTLGLRVSSFTDFLNLSFGLTTYTPIERSFYMDTGEVFGPEYGLYRARTQRPIIALGVGAQLSESLFLGFGFQTAFTSTSKVTSFLATSEGKVSSARFNTSLKPKPAYYMGFLYEPENARDWTYGMNVRFPSQSEAFIETRNKGEIFASSGSVSVNFNSDAVLFYDPLTIELGASHQVSRRGRAIVQVDFERWSKYKPPTLNIADQGTGIFVQNSDNPDYKFRDIWIPRAGYEHRFSDRWEGRFGYAYRPSILANGVAGLENSGNFIDPPKHIAAVGAGFQFQHLLGFKAPWQLDFHAAAHFLESQTVKKSSGPETDNASGDTKIGAPGYETGGFIYGGGATLSIAI